MHSPIGVEMALQIARPIGRPCLPAPPQNYPGNSRMRAKAGPSRTGIDYLVKADHDGSHMRPEHLMSAWLRPIMLRQRRGRRVHAHAAEGLSRVARGNFVTAVPCSVEGRPRNRKVAGARALPCSHLENRAGHVSRRAMRETHIRVPFERVVALVVERCVAWASAGFRLIAAGSDPQAVPGLRKQAPRKEGPPVSEGAAKVHLW